MIYLYTSNNLTSIIETCLKLIKKNPLKNPFEKEYFLIENKNMEQWINIFIAEKEKISANIKFETIYNFIWKTFEKNLNIRIKKNEFEKDSLTWKIMNIISKKNIYSGINKTDTETKKIYFCTFMANLFINYSLHRCEIINSWERDINFYKNDSSEKWQKNLWKILTKKEKNWNFSKLLNIYVKKIKFEKSNYIFFTKRIFVIGIHHLCSSYLNFFNQISPFLDIYIFIISPYQTKKLHFLKKNKSFDLNIKNKIEKNILLNPLFQFFKYAYERFFLLKNIKIKKHLFIYKKVNNPKKKLLPYLQNKLFFFNKKKIFDQKLKKKILQTDFSLSIHCCHNIRREIEILHDNLLRILNENKKIFPKDILILCSNTEDYSTTIKSVFNREEKEKFIPFTILNEISKKNKIIIYLLEKLLKFHYCKFYNTDIIELLQYELISRKFNFSKKEVEILKIWIKNSNIRWGLDNLHIKKLNLPPTNKNTWEFGIKRFLLGYAMNNSEKSWMNTISFSITEENEINILEKLIQFITILKKWRKIISKSKLFNDWIPIFKKMIFYFFLEKDFFLKKKYDLYKKIWKKTIFFSIKENYQEKISIDIFSKKFLINIKKFFRKKNFSKNKVNFSNLYNFSIIPFKVIYLIGFNEDIYPRVENIKYFDLIKKNKNIGDPDLKEKDYYTFLEILISAKDYLILSYINYRLENDLKVNPSILINKLLNYIKTSYFINDEQSEKEILQHIHLFHSENSFDAINFNNVYNYQSFDDNWFNILLNNNNNNREFKFFKKIDFYFEKEIKLKKFILFWKNPIRFFLKKRIGITFPEKNENLIKMEPFSLNSLENYKLNEKILNEMINKKNERKILKKLESSGELPYNFNYFYINKNTYKELLCLTKKILINKTTLKTKEIYIRLSKNIIYGKLENIQKTGILKWKPTLLNYNDMISLWLEHLIYCISEKKGNSVIYGLKNKKYFFSPIKKKEALFYLENYIKGYLEGLNHPLLLIKSSFSWIEKIYDKIKKDIISEKKIAIKARKSFLDTWNGNTIIPGEKEDLYIKKIIPEITEELLEEIYKTCKKWIIPILNHIND
ncbi:exodeoxyribonuclease V subunit gamma [Buchnera aphidicola]|uniref:exodeoxyribonuclease V subunit gamma n=1 Tax=Buchnera aphidicola TaxID=9 RepID=UPI0031B68BA6